MKTPCPMTACSRFCDACSSTQGLFPYVEQAILDEMPSIAGVEDGEGILPRVMGPVALPAIPQGPVVPHPHHAGIPARVLLATAALPRFRRRAKLPVLVQSGPRHQPRGEGLRGGPAPLPVAHRAAAPLDLPWRRLGQRGWPHLQARLGQNHKHDCAGQTLGRQRPLFRLLLAGVIPAPGEAVAHLVGGVPVAGPRDVLHGVR